MFCDDAVDSFMRGNFSRFQRTIDKLDAIKTTNIRTILNQEEMLLMQTEEMDFNERFRTEAAGSSAVMGQDGSEEEEELPAQPPPSTWCRSSGYRARVKNPSLGGLSVYP